MMYNTYKFQFKKKKLTGGFCVFCHQKTSEELIVDKGYSYEERFFCHEKCIDNLEFNNVEEALKLTEIQFKILVLKYKDIKKEIKHRQEKMDEKKEKLQFLIDTKKLIEQNENILDENWDGAEQIKKDLKNISLNEEGVKNDAMKDFVIK